jgi:hypothetical protein
MRSALFIAAGIVVAMSGQALAASQTDAGSSNPPANDGAMQSTTPSSPSSTAPPDTTSSAGGAAADTSATAGAAAALSVGEPVKDNTGATIGAISSLKTATNGQQMAVIKMGNDTFQVPSDRLGAGSGSVTINLSQAQIANMIHPAAGGR